MQFLLYRHCQLRQASCIDDLQFAKRFSRCFGQKSCGLRQAQAVSHGHIAGSEGWHQRHWPCDGRKRPEVYHQWPQVWLGRPRRSFGAILLGQANHWKKPWLIWWPPLPRVKMAHGPFHVLRIPPRLKQESSYCITSPRMRTILWSCLPPGRSRRPADFFAGMWIKFPIAIFHLNQPLKQGPLEGKMWMCSCEFESLKNPFHLDVAWFCLHEHSMLPVTCLITSLEMKLPKVWNPMLPSCGIFLSKHMSTQCLHIAPSFYQMVFSVALNPKWM